MATSRSYRGPAGSAAGGTGTASPSCYDPAAQGVPGGEDQPQMLPAGVTAYSTEYDNYERIRFNANTNSWTIWDRNGVESVYTPTLNDICTPTQSCTSSVGGGYAGAGQFEAFYASSQGAAAVGALASAVGSALMAQRQMAQMAAAAQGAANVAGQVALAKAERAATVNAIAQFGASSAGPAATE